MKEDVFRRVAIEEVMNPSFELTKQYLSVHRIPTQNGIPIVERVDNDAEDGTVVVYFPIEGQRYFLSVTLDTEPDVSVRFIHMEAGNRVELIVCSEQIELKTLVTESKIWPTKTWKKGEYINKKIKRKHEDSGFSYEPNPEMADELEDKLEKLLFRLEAIKCNLVKLSSMDDVQMEISIAYYGYKDQMWGWHLEPTTVRRIAELNASIDFDLYAGGPDLLE